MRPIDADALKGKLEPKPQSCYSVSYNPSARPYIALNAIMNAIDNAPTLNEWFPVNEKLPNKEGVYLVTVVSNDRKVITLGGYYLDNGNWDVEKFDKNLTVAYWCKLPEEDDNESIT